MTLINTIRQQLKDLQKLLDEQRRIERETNNKIKLYGTLNTKQQDKEDIQEDGC